MKILGQGILFQLTKPILSLQSQNYTGHVQVNWAHGRRRQKQFGGAKKIAEGIVSSP